MTATQNAPHILIVDDVAQNIQILATMLTVDPYRISFARSGKVALQLLEQEHFDLVLLDVQMPEMNGFEVCKAIKDRAEWEDIPVLFLTAYAASDQSVEGFKVGAVDYITKPVEPLELRARVRTHLSLKQARDKILKQNQDLRQLNHEKSQLLRFVSHDLRNPLTILSSGLDYLDLKLENQIPGVQRRLLNMRVGIGRMRSIIDHFLNREVIQEGTQFFRPEAFSLASFLQELHVHHESTAHDKRMRLRIERHNDEIYTDPVALQQVLDNLLANAIKYAPEDSEVRLHCLKDEDTYLFILEDEGPGLDADWTDLREDTSQSPREGLGLRIVQKMLRLLQGRVTCEPHKPRGTRICVWIPSLHKH